MWQRRAAGPYARGPSLGSQRAQGLLLSVCHTLRRHLDLAICVGIGVLLLALSILPVSNLVTVIPGALLVFVVPGYALTLLQWGRRPTLTIGDRIIFSVGMSVALTVFTVLVLSVSRAGVTSFSVTVALASESLVLIGGAALVRYRRGSGIPRDLVLTLEKLRALVRSDKPFWGVAAVLLLAAALMVAMIVSIPSPRLTTQLFITGPDGMSSTLPSTLVTNESAAIVVGVRNGERIAVGFTIVVCVAPANGTCGAAPSTLVNWTSVLAFEPSDSYLLNLPLEAGQSIERALTFTVTVPGAYAMEISLDGPAIHRESRMPFTVAP